MSSIADQREHPHWCHKEELEHHQHDMECGGTNLDNVYLSISVEQHKGQPLRIVLTEYEDHRKTEWQMTIRQARRLYKALKAAIKAVEK